MIKNKTIIIVSISVSIAALFWSVAATLVCVKQDRQIQDLKERVSYYKENLYGCLQGKLRLRDYN